MTTDNMPPPAFQEENGFARTPFWSEDQVRAYAEQQTAELHENDRRKTAEYNVLVQENRALLQQTAELRAEVERLRGLVRISEEAAISSRPEQS